MLKEIRVIGELFKYFLLIKRAPRISKVHFLGYFFVWRPCIIHQIKGLKWLGATQTTSRESGWRPHLPQIWPGASLRDYINCLKVLVWPPGPNQLIQAVKRQFEAKLGILTGWMLTRITPKVVGQLPKYFGELMYSWVVLFGDSMKFFGSYWKFWLFGPRR